MVALDIHDEVLVDVERFANQVPNLIETNEAVGFKLDDVFEEGIPYDKSNKEELIQELPQTEQTQASSSEDPSKALTTHMVVNNNSMSSRGTMPLFKYIEPQGVTQDV